MIRHAHSHNGFSSESIPLCQVSQPKSESPDNVISINVPVISSNINEKTQKRKSDDDKIKTSESSRYMRLGSVSENVTEFNGNEHSKKNKHKKYLNSLENISNSLQNLLDCVPIYNYCQNKKYNENLDYSKRKEARTELEPLFIVGKQDAYLNDEASRNVVHHTKRPSMSPEETEMYQKLLPQETKPRRYSKSSLKKQKVSLYDERELDLHNKVPTPETKFHKAEVEPTEKPRPKTLTTAEIKRRTFLRKVSLQDTYLNYNQDYWLDFEKSGRFHRSIDLGYFGNEDEQKAEAKEKQGPKPKLTETITEKSNELVDSAMQEEEIQSKAIIRQSDLPSKSHRSGKHFVRGESEPLIVRNKKCSCNNCGSRVRTEAEVRENSKTVTEMIADLQANHKDSTQKSFALPSNENIPLFYERNGHIETDFDMLNDLLDEECLLVDKSHDADAGHRMDEFVYNGRTEFDEPFNLDSHEDLFELSRRFDLSEFCEIKLGNNDADSVKRSSIFNFQGGQAFFGENKNSTSEESDVFFSEDVDDRKRGYAVPAVSAVSVSGPTMSPTPEDK